MIELNRSNEPVLAYLKTEIEGCKNVLDLGCGQSSLIQYVSGIEYSLGVEVWQPYIDESRMKCIHKEYFCQDITTFEILPDKFDAIICFDVLEHIEKGKAVELIRRMTAATRKKVIMYLPNGFMSQDDPYHDRNKYQRHVSAWSVKDLQDLGFTVTGFSGWKPLRGEGADIRIKSPGLMRSVLHVISRWTEPFCRKHPEFAFHLFAVYEKQDRLIKSERS